MTISGGLRTLEPFCKGYWCHDPRDEHTVPRTMDPICKGYWGERIYSELAYLNEFSAVNNGKHNDAILKATEQLIGAVTQQGVVTKDSALAFEQALAPLSADVKKITMHAVGHAHIDMNWMWRYDETVNITLETFRTVLKLMDEFPDFTFSQSQASCYRIVEKYDPELLDRIRAAVKSGRWEITATHWTEADKNMSSGESMARHLLYTKRYINKLFGLPEDALRLDFEPDTFGHSANVPEILNSGGVEFYYHCRGDEEQEICNWRAPSGASVLMYRDPNLYNGWIRPLYMIQSPSFCKRNKVSDMLLVYGLGDHGGGPTRRDLERLTDMISWPLFPTIKFSKYHTYFDTIKPLKNNFPVLDRELNFIFSGCYTAQSRIKAGNRLAEAALYESEALAALLPGGKIAPELFEEPWRDVLFNQFHDILPGSGVPDTREHARGLFQETLARANSQKGLTCYAIAEMVDTSAVNGGRGIREAESEGGGAGYGVEKGYSVASVERGTGLRRGYLLLNTTEERSEVATLTMWDWPGDPGALRITDSSGKPLSFQVLVNNVAFWNHLRTELAVECTIPSMGWILVIADEDPDTRPVVKPVGWLPKVHKPYTYVLENEKIRAELETASGTIGKLIDKRTGKTAAINAGFSGFTESTTGDYPAWIIGRYKNDEEPCIIDNIEWLYQGDLRNAVKVTGRYKNSKITYVISLDKGAEHLTFNTEVDWLEPGSREKGMPQLHFKVNNTAASSEYLYDIPFGFTRRQATDMDLPGLSCVCSCPKEGSGLAFISRDKYGYRCLDNTMSLTLIHSSYLPDPFPELGRHYFSFHLAVPSRTAPEYMRALSRRLCHPIFSQSVTAHGGKLPEVYSMLSCDAAISGIKPAEDGSGDIIVRIYDDIDKSRDVVITLAGELASAQLCTVTEAPLKPLTVSGRNINVPLKKNSIATVRIRRQCRQ